MCLFFFRALPPFLKSLLRVFYWSNLPLPPLIQFRCLWILRPESDAGVEFGTFLLLWIFFFEALRANLPRCRRNRCAARVALT